VCGISAAMKEIDGRKLKHDVLTELRKRAVASVQNGESPEVVVSTLGFSRASIYNFHLPCGPARPSAR